MFSYIFKARNSQGLLVSGAMRTDRRQTAITTLKQKGYYLISIKPESKISAILHQNAGFHTSLIPNIRIIYFKMDQSLIPALLSKDLRFKQTFLGVTKMGFSKTIAYLKR